MPRIFRSRSKPWSAPARSRPRLGGGGFARRGLRAARDLSRRNLGAAALVARVVLVAQRGSLFAQWTGSAKPQTPALPSGSCRQSCVPSRGRARRRKLEFFNGLGGFASDGREYVTCSDRARRRLRPGSMSSPTQRSASRRRPKAADIPGGQQPREPAHTLVERPRRRPVRRGVLYA